MPIILDPLSSVGAAPAPPGAFTLANLEQEVARRVGPYYTAWQDRQVPSTANFDFAVCPTLRSQIDLDSVTNLWLLRRGITLDGTPLALDISDRQRLVASYDPEQGRVFVDRPWQTIPVPGECFEFHHLDPAQQLRNAVLSGLARCFFEDLSQQPPTWQYGGIDVTAQCPWIEQQWQVSRVQYGWWFPYNDMPFDTLQISNHVIVVGGGFTYAYLPQTLWITFWRPHTSWVNGADSTTGPTADSDTLDVDPAYAASAGHIEAWRLFPARLAAAATAGLQATQQMAAAEFSRQASIYGPKRQSTFGFQQMHGPYMGPIRIGL